MPQLLGLAADGVFYRFCIQTFHLSQSQQAAAPPRQQMHTHNVFHVVLFTADNERNAFGLNGEIAASGPGTLALTAPGVPHSFALLQPGQTVYHELTFSLEAANRTFQGNWRELMAYYCGKTTLTAPAVTTLDGTRTAMLDKHFRRLGEALKHVVGDSMFPALNGVAGLLEFLYCNVFTTSETPRAADGMAAVKAFIEQRHDERLCLAELGRHFFMSPEHLCRKFKAVYAVAPLKYAMELKISKAKTMLLNSERSIKEIAERLGFADVYAFAKSFKKSTGTPPGKFRQVGMGPARKPRSAGSNTQHG